MVSLRAREIPVPGCVKRPSISVLEMPTIFSEMMQMRIKKMIPRTQTTIYVTLLLLVIVLLVLTFGMGSPTQTIYVTEGN